jgi:hypothetical protein
MTKRREALSAILRARNAGRDKKIHMAAANREQPAAVDTSAPSTRWRYQAARVAAVQLAAPSSCSGESGAGYDRRTSARRLADFDFVTPSRSVCLSTIGGLDNECE